MSPAMYSRYETMAVTSPTNLFNGAFDDSRQCASNAFNTCLTSDDFSVNKQSCPCIASDYFWRSDCSNVTPPRTTSPLEYSTPVNQSSDFENQYSCQKLCPNGTIPNISADSPGYSCKFVDSTENVKIWRPFSPSPSRLKEPSTFENRTALERTESCKNSFNVLHTITPSRVKIEPSKSSVFKPFKKKSYSCIHCSITYLSSVQLISHMRVHTGAKPYRCEYPNCFKTFARNEELTRHRRIHSGYKPHLCTICGKTFGRKDHLSKHLKTHLQVSEKKIYVCCVPGCGHRYTRSDALTRHKSTAHSIQKSKQKISLKTKEI